MKATERFARHALATPFSELSPEAVAAAKIFILDSIGVGVAGAHAPFAQEVRQAALGWGGAAVSQSAHIWGVGLRAPAPSAAFVNGFQIHCQEYDCVHEPAVVHPMATILAALMAETERDGHVSGADLISATVLAVDVAAGIGVASKAPIKFFRPANAGVFGATLGVARLRGFSIEQALDALGYALAHCSGTMQAHVEGKPALPIQIGNAARSALVACDLAGAGVAGPHEVLEGPYGYFRLFEGDWDLAPVLESLGQSWRIAEVSHKPFPTGRAAQGGIVAIQKLREKGVTPQNLESLTLTAPPLIKRLVGRPYQNDMQVNYARLCFAYSGAVALHQGTVGLGDFSIAALTSEKIADTARRISVFDDGSVNPAAFTPQLAEATLKDGRRESVVIDALYGAPENPLSRDARLEKFKKCMAFGFGEQKEALCEKLISHADVLETLPHAAVLSQLAAGLEET